MLTEEKSVDQIEVLETGVVQVRTVTKILRNGSVIASSFHRHTLSPGDVLDNEDPRTAAIATAAWATR